MHEGALLPTGSTAVTGSVTTDLFAVALLLLAVLLLTKVKRDHDQKIRKAASVGYFDTDVARYGHGSVAPPADDMAMDQSRQPLAPSFAAPRRVTGAGRPTTGGPSPRPGPSSPGISSTDIPRPVPAFDPVAALSSRPASADGASSTTVIPSSAPPPPPPPPPTDIRRTPTALPRLDQPPPPAGNSAG